MLAATKLKPRPVESFVDSLIPSIWTLYVAIFSFVALYVYVGVSTYEHRATEDKLVGLDELLALRRLTYANMIEIRPARMKDIPAFFSSALSEAIQEMDVDADEPEGKTKPETKPPKFGDELVGNAEVALDVPMRMAVSGSCDVLVAHLAPGTSFNFATVLIVGQTYTVDSGQVRLLIFHRCQPFPSDDFQALVFRLDDGQFAFAIPDSLDATFLGPSRAGNFRNFPFDAQAANIARLVPDALRAYLDLPESFVILHRKAVDFLILSFANAQLGKRFAPERLDEAVQQLYEQKERDASYFGISASSTQLIRLGPLVYFLLSFELWRRVRRLPKGRLTSDKYWFAFETTDFFGRVYGYLCAFVPILLGAVVYALFSISQGLSLVLWGRVVTVQGLLTLDFPFAYAPGWYSWDQFAFLLLLFIPIQLAILILTVWKLVAVVRANLRPSRL
ncbi:hypothetical protein ACVIGA_003685 [Bradyrhizobium sp. USDA 3240]